MSDWQQWNDMTDTQRLVSWREACDQLAEARAEAERLTKAYGELAPVAIGLRDQVERLRAALQALYDNEKWDDDDPRLAAARAQARAAPSPGTTQEGT